MIKARVDALNQENGRLEKLKLKSERKSAKLSNLAKAKAIQKKAAANNAAKVSQIKKTQNNKTVKHVQTQQKPKVKVVKSAPKVI